MPSGCLNSNVGIAAECHVQSGGRLTGHLQVSEVPSSNVVYGNIEGLYEGDILTFHLHAPCHLLSKWCAADMVALQISLVRLLSILTVRILRIITQFHHLYLLTRSSTEQLRDILLSLMITLTIPWQSHNLRYGNVNTFGSTLTSVFYTCMHLSHRILSKMYSTVSNYPYSSYNAFAAVNELHTVDLMVYVDSI